MDYNIKYMNRKTIGAYIDKNGSIEIRCPYYTTQENIEKFVSEYSIRIEKMLTEYMNTKPVLYIGCSVPYRGISYTLTERDTDHAGFDSSSFYMPRGVSCNRIAPLLEQVYIQLARLYIIPRTLQLANQTELYPTGIKINSAKSRWGSCNAKNSLNFSWRLMMAADTQIDYVIVHELCHIKQKNHGKHFWSEVEKYIPNYKSLRDELKNIRFW